MRNHLLAALAVAVSAGLGGCAPEPAKSVATPDASAEAVPGSWTVDKTKSRLGFSASQTGTMFDGEFRNYDAKIVFDPADLSTASIDVTVDMTSAKTGDGQRDQALPGSDWFQVKDYPTARFVATNIEQTGDQDFIAHGALTIRDATKDIDLTFSVTIDGDVATAAGEATLVRTDFGVGQGEFATDEFAGLDVGVTVDIVATR